MSDDEEDETGFGGLYENGHWVWDEYEMGLVFRSDLPPQVLEEIQISTKAPTGTIEFRDDVDVIEQIRFRRRYQRKLKPGQADIITLQVLFSNIRFLLRCFVFLAFFQLDVKDIALYTAPVNILSPMLINMLHLPTTERFIRALILFCQYYLQIEEEMYARMLEMETKIRTPDCKILENQYAENLSDLRLLIAKEYCTMLIGGADTKRFHHMGPLKKRRSLSDKDARLFETLLRMCVQIVWLALGRKAFNQIELEVNRLFKSEIFNAVEHTLKTNYITKMAEEQKAVLLGRCLRHDQKLTTSSPLMNEVFCHRQMDYRMLGLGVIKCQTLTTRLEYMLVATAAPEDKILEKNVVLGIIGMPRSAFDTLLRPIAVTNVAGVTESKSKNSMSTTANLSKSGGSVKKSATQASRVYPDVVIPSKEHDEMFFPPAFPDEPETPRACSETQRLRWQKRLHRLLHPLSNTPRL